MGKLIAVRCTSLCTSVQKSGNPLLRFSLHFWTGLTSLVYSNFNPHFSVRFFFLNWGG
jgi:hypothetical protein